jgi:SAM-dependent methyltransferase
MKNFMKKIDRHLLERLIRKIEFTYYRIGNTHKCYVCNRKFGHFYKFRGGWKDVPLWIQKSEPVGSDFDNFGCPYCYCHDRDRHLFMYFDKVNLWDKMNGSKILHFAPEWNLSKRIEEYKPLQYIKADLFPNDSNVTKINATEIPYGDSTFDLIIFNHILEHIPNYLTALKEIHRVLKYDGIAIIQTPYSKLLNKNFEDEGINNDELRLFFYGQEDHVRIFSEKQFFKDLQDSGFILEIIKHDDVCSDKDSAYFGVNKYEDLIKVTK